MRPLHLLLVCPVVALLGTPFLPFVNTPTLWLGLPSVVVWVCLWCVLTSGLLAWILHREHVSGANVTAGPRGAIRAVAQPRTAYPDRGDTDSGDALADKADANKADGGEAR